MATPLRFSPLQVHAAIRQARTLHQRQPYPLPQIQNTPYVRPRIQGMVVGDEPIPQQRPAFGGAGGVMPTPGAPPATTPPPGPGQVPLPPPGGDIGGIGVQVPGRGAPLSWNPQLIFPDTALAGAGALDSTYTNAKNAAMTEFYQKYHQTLQNLGYMDAGGNYVEGDIASGDRISRQGFNQQLADEARLNTENAQDTGTLFSGIRAINQERAQRGTVTDLADLDLGTARSTSQGLTDAETAMGDFNNALIAAYNEAMYRKFGTYDYSYHAPGQ